LDTALEFLELLAWASGGFCCFFGVSEAWCNVIGISLGWHISS